MPAENDQVTTNTVPDRNSLRRRYGSAPEQYSQPAPEHRPPLNARKVATRFPCGAQLWTGERPPYIVRHGHLPRRYLREVQERQPGWLPHRARGGMEDRGAQPLAPAVPRLLRCRGREGGRAVQLHRPGRDELVRAAGAEGVAVEGTTMNVAGY